MTNTPDCGVYALLNTATGKVYVGSSRRVFRRYQEHLSELRRGTHRNSCLQEAWQQQSECFAIAVLEWCAPAQLLCRERAWITLLQADNRLCGYNLNAVQDDRFTLGPETRARKSIAHRGKVASAETRAKLSAASQGRKHSAEHRAKNSAAHRGRSLGPMSPEHRARISAALKGRTASTEARAKMSEAQKARQARESAPE